MQENRHTTRHLVRQLLRVTERGAAPVGNLVNLSAGGFMLITPQRIAPGAVLDLDIELPYAVDGRSSVSVDARCVWCEKSSFSEDYGAGFEIERIASEDARAMRTVFGAP